jgi:molybdopterin-guanine dinucleotide biosynthesis protein A
MAVFNSKEISVAVLAGGKSSRFGESKFNAYFGGYRLIDYALRVAKLISENVIVIKHPRQKFEYQAAPVVSDIIPECGPAGGIHAALEEIRTPWLAVLPCDMPFLVPEIYQVLFANRKEPKPVVAVSENGIESLVSIWHKSTSNELRNYLMKKEFTLNRILANSNAVEVEIANKFREYQPDYFYNINFKKDLDEMAKLAGLLKSNFLKNMDNIFEQLS